MIRRMRSTPRPAASRGSRALGLALLLASLAACAAPRPPVVAVSNFQHPPFSSRDASGRAVGVEVELVEDAARRLGREVRWVERPFGELLAAVAEGQADVAASTIGVTRERTLLVAFSQPYHETEIVVLVREGRDEPARLKELFGRRVASERGTTTVAAVAARIPGADQVLERTDERSWAELLLAGEIDAIALDRTHVDEFQRAAGATFAVLEEPLAVERFALAARQDDRALLEALDAAVAARAPAP